MSIVPLILGSGRASDALAKSLACINLMNPDLHIAAPVILKRGSSLSEERKKYKNAVLCIANPHGLHAQSILDADAAGFDGIICEKPACVNLNEVQKLKSVTTPTAVLHGYRQMWGIQTLKRMWESGEFGEVIAVEGRYWQSSASVKAKAKGWKDDTRLSGEFDTYLDIGSHWVDAASYLVGETPKRLQGWRSYVNAESSHRDTHVHVTLDFQKTRALASISKTVHGASNHFEINVIGSKLSATWEFLKPDELFIGSEKDRRVLTRKDSDLGSGQPPFHGLGWLEGYIEISSRLLSEVYDHKKSEYPSLKQNLLILEAMLKTEWRS